MNSLLTPPALSRPTTVATFGEPPCILVVDDDVDICRLETAILKSAGFNVATAPNGATAWRSLVASRYDLLVTDYLMPGGSGLALARQLRVAKMELPIVMVSGTLDTLDTVKLKTDPWSRIHAFVRKPFAVEQLLVAVRSALGSETFAASAPHLVPA
jgi:two-component system response regulator MtrA